MISDSNYVVVHIYENERVFADVKKRFLRSLSITFRMAGHYL